MPRREFARARLERRCLGRQLATDIYSSFNTGPRGPRPPSRHLPFDNLLRLGVSFYRRSARLRLAQKDSERPTPPPSFTPAPGRGEAHPATGTTHSHTIVPPPGAEHDALPGRPVPLPQAPTASKAPQGEPESPTLSSPSATFVSSTPQIHPLLDLYVWRAVRGSRSQSLPRHPQPKFHFLKKT